jgi:hypothetical protein
MRSHGRVVRLLLSMAIVVGLVIGGLLLLEGGGSSPVRSLETNISSNQSVDKGPPPGVPKGPPPGRPRGNNPNRHCKPNQPPFQHDCRPPSK